MRRCNICEISRARRSAPGRSALLMTNRSAASIRPAFMAWMESPDSGTSTTTVLSAAAAMSSSDWPTPTVSMMTRSKPNASSTSATSFVASASPPSEPRVAMERMKTPVQATSFMRMRSPSSAPPVNGEVGSTAITATVRRLAVALDQAAVKRGLARAGRSRDADAVRPAQAGCSASSSRGNPAAVLDDGDDAGERRPLARAGTRPAVRRAGRNRRRSCGQSRSVHPVNVRGGSGPLQSQFRNGQPSRPMPRAWRSGFSSRCVGSSSTTRNMTAPRPAPHEQPDAAQARR
jgi:hypothetical protein